MKTFRSTNGPFVERPYYKEQEIEDICIAELKGVDLYPTTPSPIRIDRFVEKRFHVTPTYEDLGAGVLGLTTFDSKGVHAIMVSRFLDEEGTGSAERRIRTTLAHEAGHGLLHEYLFLSATQTAASLFADFSDPESPKVLCRDIPYASSVRRRGYDGRWWEYQANRAIGALLLPRPLVESALDALIEPNGLLGGRMLVPNRREEGARILAGIFDVNPVVARIRLEELFPAGSEGQLGL